MTPSPRKRAVRTAATTLFNTTWHDADAALFDPSSLPLAKIPRAWERKQEVKRIGQGKEKKIWRRFNLRSRASDTTPSEVDEEEQDARSRPVKRRQQMSPKAMEKSTTRPDSKKRAFKATRWDRRKSVLPRKKTTPFTEPAPDAGNEANGDEEEEEYSLDLTEGDSASFNGPDETMEGQEEEVTDIPATNGDRTSTFTFAMEEATTSELPDQEDLEGDREMEQKIDTGSAEDTTLATLFRSPAKVDYPQLTHIDHETTEPETIVENTVEQTENMNNAEKTELEEPDSENGNQALATLTEIQYPTLPVDSIKSPSPSREEDQNMTGDSHEAAPSIAQVSQQTGDENAGDEDFSPASEARQLEEGITEASLQLDILKDYQKALRECSSSSARVRRISSGVVKQHQAAKEDLGDGSAETQEEHLPEDASASNSDEAIQTRSSEDQTMDEAPTEDITAGLALSLSPPKPASTAPRKLHSPPSRLASGTVDVSATVAFDDDTAMLKDFLNRAAASKAEKAAIATHRRESLQNRRDSDVVRHALSSPRKVLEEKDPNSPTKTNTELTLDLSQTLTLATPSEALSSPVPDPVEPEDTEETSTKGTRRSSRAKKSRLPAPASTGPAPTPKIAIRRNDGNEVVVLKKDDAKVLADLTRANTRKNKQGAFGVIVRLMKAQMEAASLPPIDDTPKEIVVGKNVRWDEQLAYYQENPETVANALAEAESLATPDELSFSDNGSEAKKKKKEKTSKTSTPKIRRVRGLGTANGTPAKGLTAPSSLLPDAVQEEREMSQDKSTSQKHQQIPKPKVTKAKKMPVASTSIDSGLSSSSSETKLASLDVAPVGVGATASGSSSLPAQRKSRLAAPRKVVLPQLGGSVEGKENSTLRGLTDATAKKGIPAPKVVTAHSAIATAGMESGLPRRKGKM